MEFIDYYKILGVDKNATDAEIKKAFRKLARKLHPDLNPNDKDAERKFKELNEANEVLSDPENRKKYDQYGKDWKHAEDIERAYQRQKAQQEAYGQQQQGFGGSGFSEGDHSDFFESFFGGGFSRGRGGQVKFRGQDFHATLHLDIKDAFTTHKQTLTVNGKNIRITIPAGVSNGQVIKIKGYGGEGMNGGPNGDLHIEFLIANNTKFKLDQANLYTTIELDLYTAMLGGEILVDTMDGQVKLKVQPETQNGTKVKLKGKGYPIYKKEGTFGDLYITYEVKLPNNLSSQEKELFNQLKQLRPS
ncbi:MAG: DnaJ domain-containing protein [Bacteroidetes bacterium]|nr:DnaJ domain-containing protein [Bacteroidota bacterium]